MLPAHGLPIVGRERIARVLDVAATALEALVRDVLAMMNGGASLDEIIHTVRVDDAVLQLPVHAAAVRRARVRDPQRVAPLRRVVGRRPGEPEAGAARPPLASRAGHTCRRVGPALAARAVELADAGDLRLACHLVELAAAAAPDDPAVHATRADIYERRRQTETSLMTKGIFAATVRESRAVPEPES